MQIVIVVFGEFAFARDAALPSFDVRNDKRKDAERVVGRDNGHTEHIPEGDCHEECFERRAHFYDMFFELVPSHTVEEFAERFKKFQTGQGNDSRLGIKRVRL